jgi:hypothetical protein
MLLSKISPNILWQAKSSFFVCAPRRVVAGSDAHDTERGVAVDSERGMGFYSADIEMLMSAWNTLYEGENCDFNLATDGLMIG